MGWRRGRIVLVAATAVVALAACSSSNNSGKVSSSDDESGFKPLTIDNCGYEQTFDKRPSRVVIMQGASVGEAETFVLLGLEDTVLANAQDYGISDIKGMAAKVDALPDPKFKLNKAMDIPAEQMLKLKPDLVISTWSGGFDPKFGFASRETLEDAGIKTLVNPANCAYGKTSDVTAKEKSDYQDASVESSLEFVDLIGDVFGVQERAADVVSKLQGELDQSAEAVRGTDPKRMLIAFPSMADMNSNGLPAVFSGGIYDSVIETAGGKPSFADGGFELTASLSAEQLAKADVDMLILGQWRPDEDLDAEAEKLFKAYPQWPASKTKSYVKVSDGIYLGPANAAAIAKIAKAAHPKSFD